MKKLFFALCFSLFAGTANADIMEVNDAAEIEQRELKMQNSTQPENIDLTPQFESKEEIDEFLKERMELVQVTAEDNISKSGAMNIQHSSEYINRQQEDSKSTFQKIYESAIARVSAEDQEKDIIAAEQQNQAHDTTEQQQQQWEDENVDFEVVDVELPPYGEKVLAPAKEHIPYLFTAFEILPSGLISVKEHVIVVANGKKLKHGLTRAIPKYSLSRAGERNKIDITLDKVSINGQEVAHKLIETDEAIIITPEETYDLPNGVYEYRFNYAVDRRLWMYQDFNEFYWDVTGSSWNLVITRASASLRLPGSKQPIGYSFLLGYIDTLSEDNTFVMRDESGTIAFVAQRPLFVGEGMYLIVSIDKEGFDAPTLSQRFNRFINDRGDVLFALLGLLAVLISYFISWQEMKYKTPKNNLTLKKNAPMLRYLARGSFDRISFGAFLLEMFKKNLIDILRSGGEIIIVKKTDNLSMLNRYEKKAMQEMFVGRESVLSFGEHSFLKLKRAYKEIEKDITTRVRNFALKLNVFYLLFSTGMLLLIEFAIALNSVDKLQMMGVLAVSDIFLFGGTIGFKYNSNTKWKNYACKTLFAAVVLTTTAFMSIFINMWAAIFIAIIVYAILAYTEIFTKRSGLIKSNIMEAQNYKQFLLEKKDTFSSGRDFLNQQANIFAFDLEQEFLTAQDSKDFYRIDLVREIVSKAL